MTGYVYVGLERAIFPLLEQYLELGTSLESRAKLPVEQPAWTRFERAVLLREMLVRLFLHYNRGKSEVPDESSIPARLEDLYGIPLNHVTRSLPLHSAALNSSDIVFDIRRTGGILDSNHKMPLRLADFTGRHLLSTAIKCLSPGRHGRAIRGSRERIDVIICQVPRTADRVQMECGGRLFGVFCEGHAEQAAFNINTVEVSTSHTLPSVRLSRVLTLTCVISGVLGIYLV